MTTYGMDNAWAGERWRLQAMENLWDAGTFRHLAALGVGPGWQCWEVGAGGGTVAAWLCEQVGPTGSLLATDIDPRFVEALALPNLVAKRHDIVQDPLPNEQFD